MSDSPINDPDEFLTALFKASLEAVSAESLMDFDYPQPIGRSWVIGAGKAAAAMAAALERHWPADTQGELEGMVVTRYGHACKTRGIEVIEAAHPVPDDQSISAAARIMQIAENAGENDQVIVLISGGASALLVAPGEGITLDQKRHINQALLASGAPITEMNCVRRHLSAIKGGRLARLIEPASSLTLIISDVPGDNPATIGSGPTVADSSTPADALAILTRLNISIPDEVRRVLESDISPVTLDREKHTVRLLGTADLMLRRAAEFSRRHGVRPIILGDDIEVDAEALASVQASLARYIARDTLEDGTGCMKPCVLLSGGETGVTVRGSGRGGRNSQYLLALALALNGLDKCWALACDSDGIDGTGDNAGGIITPDSLQRAQGLGLVPSTLLSENDGYHFLEALDNLVMTGPTLTNVNDLRAILIER
ncbi:MAG: hydroxypyruvate reductase [marine bacterium B5-7]|nr:MAG: hydroxypyruvate reductase [marine bacterium B5-7]